MEDARVQKIYEELGKLVIELHRDPVSQGPAYMQDLISKTRGYLNQTSFYLAEVLRERHRQEMDLDAREAAFQIDCDALMANDRRVSTLPAIQDRLSMVNVLLGDQRREILTLKRVIKNLGLVERVVRHRHKELENTMSAIRLQRSLVEAEIRTGAVYGDENDQSRGSRWGKQGSSTPMGDDMTEADLKRLMEEAEQELVEGSEGQTEGGTSEALEEADVQAPDSSHEASSSGEDPDIERFLSEEEDLTGIFNDL